MVKVERGVTSQVQIEVIRPLNRCFHSFFKNAYNWLVLPPNTHIIPSVPLKGKWTLHSLPKSAFYPVAPPRKENKGIFALGIAICAYAGEPLINPKLDLKNFCYEICHAHFGIPYNNAVVMSDYLALKKYDPNRDNVETQLSALMEKVNSEEDGVGVFYFSGHGLKLPVRKPMEEMRRLLQMMGGISQIMRPMRLWGWV